MTDRTHLIIKHIHDGNFFDKMALFLDYLMPDIHNEDAQDRTKDMIDSFRDLQETYELSIKPKEKN